GRPCSGYLLEADGFTLLIDPGYGVATALSIGEGIMLDAVLVSHSHPDHCTDLNPILRARAWADDPLPLLPVHALSGALDAVLAEVISSLSSAADVGQEAVRSGVERLVLTHLMPNTNETDATAAAARHFAGSITVARPGLVVEV